MKIVLIIFAAGLIIFAWALCKIASKKTPTPGKDFDERGPY